MSAVQGGGTEAGKPLPLAGIKVVDMATVVAGPAAARYLADFGAEVVKVEAPTGDPTRRMGWRPPDGGDSYVWKILGRNKQCVTLDLKSDRGHAEMLSLVDAADVVIENLRPGTLERLHLDPEGLIARNPKLVVLRVTGFGQDGPYANRPGFATLAEALSGYAAISGEPDGPPLLPPIAITDEITGIVGAFSVMVALWHARDSGEGQVVDVNLLETLLQMMGPLVSAYAHLGYEQPRLGSGLPWTVPRGIYCCADGRWVALSASADAAASRLLHALRLESDPRYSTSQGRFENREELERYVQEWMRERNFGDVISTLLDVDVAVAPVYTMADVFADPHVAARQTLVEVDGVVMPGVIARLSRTPGLVRHAGRAQSADQTAVLRHPVHENDRGAVSVAREVAQDGRHAPEG
jgi:crotonobetainyl-CoA:carnitine CoA-transferase CaiB-like acyl-CoA transferase